MAEESIKNIGVNACYAAILWDLFVWGLTEESRENSSKKLKKSLEKSKKDIEEGKYHSAEDVLKKLEQRIIDECSEDEKQHRIYEKEYKKKVKEIEECHAERVFKDNHEKFIKAVKSEFQRRQNVEDRRNWHG